MSGGAPAAPAADLTGWSTISTSPQQPAAMPNKSAASTPSRAPPAIFFSNAITCVRAGAPDWYADKSLQYYTPSRSRRFFVPRSATCRAKRQQRCSALSFAAELCRFSLVSAHFLAARLDARCRARQRLRDPRCAPAINGFTVTRSHKHRHLVSGDPRWYIGAMQSVLITGANRGLGLSLVQKFSSEGWQVFAAERSRSAASPALPNVSWVSLDVQDEGSIARAAASIAERSDGLDVLINNAAVNPRPDCDAPLGSLDFAAMQLAYDVNALGPLRVIQ